MKFGLTSVRISSCSCHCGKALTSLQLPEKCVIIGILREQQVILVSAEPTIWHGDYILAVALNSALVPMLNFALNKRHSVHYSPPKCLIKKSTNIY
nr:TrkA C-terminal domain-containing protein [Nostoc sp. PCC 7524]